MGRYAAVILAGGRARRMGGVDKPSITVDGVPLLHRVLATVADADPRIVVGPPTLRLPEGVHRTQEAPPGSGPAAAAAAGLTLIPPGVAQVALLAADMPFLTAAAVDTLRRVVNDAGVDGAVCEDDAGRPQWLCGVWRVESLRARLAPAPAWVPSLVARSGSACRLTHRTLRCGTTATPHRT